jgi:glycerophosphoryl diester phosphodiesterase
VPSLDEALEWARPRAPLAVELKGWPTPDPLLVERTVEALRRHDMLGRAIVISFDHPALGRVRALEPELQTGVLYACRPVDAVALARVVGAEALLPHWSYVVAEDVARAHAAGLMVQPWESSDPDVLRACLAAGVDGVASNRPDVARAVVEEVTGR